MQQHKLLMSPNPIHDLDRDVINAVQHQKYSRLSYEAHVEYLAERIKNNTQSVISVNCYNYIYSTVLFSALKQFNKSAPVKLRMMSGVTFVFFFYFTVKLFVENQCLFILLIKALCPAGRKRLNPPAARKKKKIKDDEIHIPRY